MINSPCISQCKLNEDNLCISCYRYNPEIIVWKNLNDLARQCVIDNSNRRKIDNKQ